MNQSVEVVAAADGLSVTSDAGEAEWDSFVRSHPEGTGYHLWRWRRIFEGAFGHRTEYLAVREGAAIVGVLPLVVLEQPAVWPVHGVPPVRELRRNAQRP